MNLHSIIPLICAPSFNPEILFYVSAVDADDQHDPQGPEQSEPVRRWTGTIGTVLLHQP